jgi:hypothetical protein
MEMRVRRGATKRVARVVALDATGEPATGLRAGAAGSSAWFIREGDAHPARLDLRPPAGAQHAPGTWREIDPRAMPGVYELHLPDDLFAGSGFGAMLMVRFPQIPPIVVEFDLVAYDPYDPERLGLSCLSQESRHACLATAFREVVPAIIEEHHGRAG